MAKPIVTGIHLVTPQVPPKPSLDPADIAAAVLETVRECKQALTDFCDYHEAAAAQMGSQLNALELVALRAIAPKSGALMSTKQDSTQLTKVYFKEPADLWLDSRRMFIAQRTYKDNVYYIKTLSSFFGEFKLTEITPDLLRAYQQMRRERVYGRKINQEIGCLAQMLKRIGRWQDLTVDYQPLQVSRQSPGRALSEAEYKRLTRHAMSKPEWEGAYLFMILSTNTTAGPKELWTLQHRDYDRERKRIQIGRKEAKNAYRTRVIPLNEVAFAAMERVLELARKRGSRLPEHCLFPYRISGNARGGNTIHGAIK